MSYLPITKSELNGQQADFILISADAYVDHPSFGHALIARWIESKGFCVGIIPQPLNNADYQRLGKPKYAFLISGGVVDSMVNNYTVAKLKRKEDSYSEGGVNGKRPDRATTVYAQALRRLYPDVAIIIGGIEASLRRFAHYDYWTDRVMPSILIDSQADLLVYGMGEKPFAEICDLVAEGIDIKTIKHIRGTAYLTDSSQLSALLQDKMPQGQISICPSFEDVVRDKKQYVKAFNIQSKNNDAITARIVVQRHGDNYVVQNQPQYPLDKQEMDSVYALPFERNWHPTYANGVPALEEVKFSLTSVRGCFGRCSYCALTYHQGRYVQQRSQQSIVDEAKLLIADKQFKGYIHDVGGPTANFRFPACDKQSTQGACSDKQCIGFEPCAALKVDHSDYLQLLRKLRSLEGVKKVFVRSGIRYDYLMMDDNDEFFKELTEHHVSGQLKVAPEHTQDSVLKLMNKPSFAVYKAFKQRFDTYSKKIGKKQYLVPYLISSHPGCTIQDAVKVAEYLHSVGYMPEQVQDFYPTPSTKSTCMFYTGLDPDTMQPIYVPTTKEDKRLQRALLQYKKTENYYLVRQALLQANRRDLIGNRANCLIKEKINTSSNAQFGDTANNKTKLSGSSRNMSKTAHRKPYKDKLK